MKVPFVDLQRQYRDIRPAAERRLARLFKRADFILGEDVTAFEASFAAYTGVRHALGVNSGTDALFLSLLSLDIKPGDEVIVPAFTYIASSFAVTYTGARPVFADIDEKTFLMDPRSAERAITKKTKAIMPVHLFGLTCDMDAIRCLARQYGLKIIEDAAQAHGSEFRARKAGTFGDAAAFSFYPTKNLGAFGDGGMITTNDALLHGRLKKLRDYGRRSRYVHESVGYNSRLDSVQAVFLKEKLKKLDGWNERRREAAAAYRRLLSDMPSIVVPEDPVCGRHVYHIFGVRVPRRDAVLEGLKKAGIGAMVHYPVPLPLQDVYRSLGNKKGDFPAAEAVSKDILCLPIFPHISRQQVSYVANTLKGLVRRG